MNDQRNRGSGSETMDINRFLAELETIMDMESPSSEPVLVKRVSDWFKEQLDALGWHTRQVDVGAQAGPLLVASNRECDVFDIAFFAHIDTVFPAGTTGKWRFSVQGNEVHGPGACDMKQGALAMLYIARGMDEALKQKLNVAMVFTPDEEIGSPFSRQYLRQFARRCNAVIITEAGWTDGARCISRNGKLRAQVRFTGIPAHAGYIFSAENASALLEAACWTQALMAMRNRERELTVNVGRIEGGTADNIVPENAVMSFEARFRHSEDHDKVRDQIAHMLAHPYVEGVHATLEALDDCPTLEQGDRADRLIGQLRRACESVGETLHFRHRCGVSDGNLMAEYAPVIDSMGPCGEFGHSDREYMRMDTVAPTVDVSLALLRCIAEDK